jgi:glycosyltransferase involved in cell wall biosynthesis
VRIPPEGYGGTERVIHHLTEELVRRGHDVTLFAAGTSSTSAKLEAGCPEPLWELRPTEPLAYRILQAERVAELSAGFDIIHSHEYLPWLAAQRMSAPMLTTLHGRLDRPEIAALLGAHREQALVSISDAQRRPLAELDLNWIRTVHHGLDLERRFALGAGAGGYLVFLGRMAAEKGAVSAIRIATRAGLKLKIAARVAPEEEEYFKREVEPLLDHPLVEWVGEANDEQKARLMQGALGLLVPIHWDEPFGLVFIEALACGTPVLSRPLGSLPEILRDGVHGFLRNGDDELIEAAADLDRIDRRACREWALSRFSVPAMTDGYELAYEQVLAPMRAAVSARN